MLGRVLGLDRAPEVKTIRRKIGQLAGQGKADQLLAAMAAHHLARHTQDVEQAGIVLYVDGHVRAYQGTRKTAKTHAARLKFPAPATVETRISDGRGDPVLAVMAEPAASLAYELRRLLPALRRAVGDSRRVLVGFDRGGWSPSLFAHMHEAGFDTLTWRKQPAPDIDQSLFAAASFTDEGGLVHTWQAADTPIELPIDEHGGTFGMRQITRLIDTKTLHGLSFRLRLHLACGYGVCFQGLVGVVK
jgi:prepilin-type processing-associated H-X9-DG protein